MLYGHLMEYIDGCHINSDVARDLCPDRQASLVWLRIALVRVRIVSDQSPRIQSCRILDLVNTGQQDWHPGQIFLNTDPRPQVDHAVLIDFAPATRTSGWVPEEDVNFLQSYIRVLFVFTSTDYPGAALDPDIVWTHFGEQGEWDTSSSIVPVAPGRNESRDVRPRSLFSFLSSSVQSH